VVNRMGEWSWMGYFTVTIGGVHAGLHTLKGSHTLFVMGIPAPPTPNVCLRYHHLMFIFGRTNCGEGGGKGEDEEEIKIKLCLHKSC